MYKTNRRTTTKLFTCPRCNYETNRKLNLGHHFDRKNLCKDVNGVDLDDQVKERAMSCKVNATNNATAKNFEQANKTSDITASHNAAASHNTETSHNDHSLNTNSNNITLNIHNLSSDFPLLLKYESLYRQLCGDMPAKQTIDAKRKRLFSRAIRELDKFDWTESDGKFPPEINIKGIITMIRSLIDIPQKYKMSAQELIHKTMTLNDEKSKQTFVYGSNRESEPPGWKSKYEVDNIDNDDPKYSHAIRMVKERDIIDTYKRIYGYAQDDLQDDEDDEDDVYSQTIDVQEETARITESVSKIVHKIFQQECVNNPEFLKKMNDIDAKPNEESNDYDVPLEYNIGEYTKI